VCVCVSERKRAASNSIYFTASDNEACGRSNQSEKQSVVTLLKVSTSAKDNERQAKLVCGHTKFTSTPFSSSKYRSTLEQSV